MVLPKYEQLVGCLWIIGGHMLEIPHRELKPDLYAVNEVSEHKILSKFGIRLRKC
jgi:hypothetical protein